MQPLGDAVFPISHALNVVPMSRKCKFCGAEMKSDWEGDPSIPGGIYRYWWCPECDDPQIADDEPTDVSHEPTPAGEKDEP